MLRARGRKYSQYKGPRPVDFRFSILDFFVLSLLLKGRAEDKPNLSHLTVFASLHQKCTIQRSIHIAYLYPFNQFSVIYRIAVEGIPHAVDIKQAESIVL